MRRPKFRDIWLSTLALAMLTVALVSLVSSESPFDSLDVIIDVRHEIMNAYVDKPDEEKMVEAAVRGMIDALDDPYTIFLNTEQIPLFEEEVRDQFTGIGAVIADDKKLKRVRIVSPLEDSPAWRAGVMPGDVVLEVDGETTEGQTVGEVVKRLKGPENTDVHVKLRHESGDVVDVTITRALISVKSVRGFRRDEQNRWVFMLDADRGIAYVRIRQFNERTADELRAALTELKARSARGLILDLRFNPGGLLSAALATADMFLEGGRTIVSVKGRVVPRKVEKSKSGDVFEDVPIVVLANEASASASEIVTGALTDNGRAQFVGMRTFGKASVQQTKMLESQDGALKFTTAYYYLPNGRLIHRREESKVWGVDPADGFFVPMSPEQMLRMREIQVENKVLRDLDGSIVTADWIDEKMADPQLAAGLRAIIGKVETGDWPVVGEAGAEVLVRHTRRQTLLRVRDRLQENLEEIQQKLEELEAEDPAAAAAEDGKAPAEQDKASAAASPTPEAADKTPAASDKSPAATNPTPAEGDKTVSETK